jgi:hypothetical protein
MLFIEVWTMYQALRQIKGNEIPDLEEHHFEALDQKAG